MLADATPERQARDAETLRRWQAMHGAVDLEPYAERARERLLNIGNGNRPT